MSRGTYHKQWRADRIAEGKCVSCPRPAQQDRTECRACARRNSAKRLARWRQWRQRTQRRRAA